MGRSSAGAREAGSVPEDWTAQLTIRAATLSPRRPVRPTLAATRRCLAGCRCPARPCGCARSVLARAHPSQTGTIRVRSPQTVVDLQTFVPEFREERSTAFMLKLPPNAGGGRVPSRPETDPRAYPLWHGALLGAQGRVLPDRSSPRSRGSVVRHQLNVPARRVNRRFAPPSRQVELISRTAFCLLGGRPSRSSSPMPSFEVTAPDSASSGAPRPAARIREYGPSRSTVGGR